MKSLGVVAMAAALLAGGAARADFDGCKSDVAAEAERAGAPRATVAQAFDGVTPDPKVLDLERAQPEFKTPLWDYVAGVVDDERVHDGRAAMGEHAAALSLAERRYGVDRHVVAAIWGIESDFGKKLGDRPLVQSLLTLACSPSRRPGFFRKELIATLKIAGRGDLPLDRLKGSWAGAFGQTQFMPTSFLHYAVDLDGSGRDIVDNPAAALGSTANYLKSAGWREGQPWGFEVKLPSGYDGPSGRKGRHPTAFWRARGVARIDGGAMPDVDAGLFLPAGANGPAFLVTRNFDAILAYNASDAYALSVALLAQRLGGGPGLQGDWPTDDPGLSRVERKETQELLAKRGYDVGTPDGVIGDKSHAALADFQGKNGLRADGRASQKTLAALRR